MYRLRSTLSNTLPMKVIYHVSDVALWWRPSLSPLITDSVYDVCDKKHNSHTLETDAVRPDDPEERHLLNDHNGYADQKLRAEEELSRLRQEGGFPFIIIRLPDVIGPRDNTYRWWIYQLWIKVRNY